MHEVLELFTQCQWGDTDSTGDPEEYKKESEIVICADVVFALLAVLFWSLTVKYGFCNSIKTTLFALFGVAVSGDTKYHTLPFSKYW